MCRALRYLPEGQMSSINRYHDRLGASQQTLVWYAGFQARRPAIALSSAIPKIRLGSRHEKRASENGWESRTNPAVPTRWENTTFVPIGDVPPKATFALLCCHSARRTIEARLRLHGLEKRIYRWT